MTWSPDSSITGPTTITGLTTPTYGLISGPPSEPNSRSYVVSSLGGTQTNVRYNSAGDPFTLVIKRGPYKRLPPKNPSNGTYANVPYNRTEIFVKKGVYIDSDDVIRDADMRFSTGLPAGSEANDAINIRAMVAFFIGVLTEEANDFCETLETGVF